MSLGVPLLFKKPSLENNFSKYNAEKQPVLIITEKSLDSERQQHHMPVSMSSRNRLIQQQNQHKSQDNSTIKLQKALTQSQNIHDSPIQSSHIVQLVQEANQKHIDQQTDSMIKIKQKLRQIEKSMKINDDQSIQRRSETEIEYDKTSIISIKKQSQRELFNSVKDKGNVSQVTNYFNVNLGQERKLFDVMNQRFKRIKQIHNRGELIAQKKQIQRQSTKEKVRSQLQQNLPSFVQQSIQTQQYKNQKQIQLKDEIQSLKQSYNKSNTQKNELQLQNKFLKDKINLLQKNLQKYQTELIELKLLIKDKTHQYQQGKILQWRVKQEIYLNKISILQKQLYKALYFKKNRNQNSGLSEISQIASPKIIKNRLEQDDDQLQKIRRYEKFVENNMQIVKKQQQKIINQWRIIKSFYSRAIIPHHHLQ